MMFNKKIKLKQELMVGGRKRHFFGRTFFNEEDRLKLTCKKVY